MKAYWRPQNNNLGDMLTPSILKHFTKSDDIELAEREDTGKLLAVGSIIEHVRSRDIVWGSGIHRPDFDFIKKHSVTFKAVRGPKTRAILQKIGYEVPEVYGDPAILLPLFYRPTVVKKYKVGYIPHQVDYKVLKEKMDQYDDTTLINITNSDWRFVVDKILECEHIVSSSLHGIIIAESYGIPATWSIHTGGVWGKDFKFQDYFESTDRFDCRPMIPLTPPKNIEKLQRKLLQVL